MKNGWTEERRQRQAQLIKTWQPWSQSTGPRTDNGKHISCRNAYKGGSRDKLSDEVKRLKQLMQQQADFIDTF